MAAALEALCRSAGGDTTACRVIFVTFILQYAVFACKLRFFFWQTFLSLNGYVACRYVPTLSPEEIGNVALGALFVRHQCIGPADIACATP